MELWCLDDGGVANLLNNMADRKCALWSMYAAEVKRTQSWTGLKHAQCLVSFYSGYMGHNWAHHDSCSFCSFAHIFHWWVVAGWRHSYGLKRVLSLIGALSPPICSIGCMHMWRSGPGLDWWIKKMAKRRMHGCCMHLFHEAFSQVMW